MTVQFVGFSRRSRRFFFARRQVVVAMAALLSVSGVSVVATAQPAAAAPVSIRLDKSAPASVLVGAPITYSVTATNPKDDDADVQYNLSFRDVLPKGVAYVSTSAPKGLGDPQQIAELGSDNLPTGRTILIWSNVADLPDGSDVTLTYQVQPDADAYRVGEQVTNEATGYVSKNERYLAKFSARGDLVANAAISSAAGTATTTVTALQLQKSEPSSEHELVRGVHDRPTRYSLKVTNNARMATNDVTVVDYLPAGLEFLGCGGVDNSSGREYPGAASLTQTPVITTGDGCLPPRSVTTVNNPTGYPAGVYTRVEWKLPTDLAPSATTTITYAAGIPLRSNVMPAAGFTATANLDNNTGALTRETGSEIGLTNRAMASGAYQGLNRAGQTNIPVSATDSVTVTSEDIAVAKKIRDADAFAQGGQVQYDLTVRTSEYTDGSDITLVDTLPDGLCPSDAPASTYTQTARDQAGSGQCAPAGSNDAIKTVDFVDGMFVVTFKAFDLTAADRQRVISYKARMRTTYNTGDEQTSAGDSYTNKVALTGTTTPVAATGATGTQSVKDVSEATLDSGSPTLDKRILRNTAAPHSCDDSTWTSSSTGNWFDTQAAAGDAPFTVGSRVCFQVRVTFPSNTSTRVPVVTDYLPDNLKYEADSFKLVQGVNTVELNDKVADIETALTAGTASLHPGTDVGAQRYVAKGQVFAFRLSAIVQPNTKSTVDVQGNLAKLRWTDRAGRVSSLRDLADFQVPPVPPVTIDKQVAKSPYTAYANSQVTKHGDVLRFKVDTVNGGTTPIGDVEVWDVLPAPFTCATVSAVTDGGTCTDPGATGHPMFSARATLSAIRWVLPATVAASGRTSVTYDVTVPTATSVGTSYTNTAYVRSFTTPTNLGTAGITHYPASNVDTLVLPTVYDAAAASDPAAVSLPAVGLTKSSTSVTDTNNAANQAVPGETVDYTIRASVPARTTVYNGVLTDPLPTGLTFVSAAAKYSADGTLPASGDLPTGSDFTASSGRLALPATFTNSTNAAQVFEVTIKAKITPSHTGTTALGNTATFGSTTTVSTTSPKVANVTATSSVTPIHPSPAITKALTTTPAQDSAPGAGQSREYVLKASNAAGRPTLYDSQVVDCVPAGLTVTVLPAEASQAATVANDACQGVPGTGTTITWQTDTIKAGETKSLTYTVRVNLDAAGGQTYKNVATVTGSSLSNSLNDKTVEEVLTRSANATLTVPAASITKKVAQSQRTIGDRATYTVEATLPANAKFYNALISDLLPLGIDASSVQTTSVTCSDSDGDCTLPSSGAPMTASAQTVGWLLGDLDSSTKERTVKVTFTALVNGDNCASTSDPKCNKAGKPMANTATVSWDLTDLADPVLGGRVQDKSVTSGAATFTVQEPKTAVSKAVSNAAPAPGETFTYTVKAWNPAGTNVSDAYNAIVTDVVPDGVIVDLDSLEASGGVYVAGTRTIVWPATVLTIGSGAARPRTFTYQATLAPSAQLTGGVLVNTAKVASFASLPSDGRTYEGPSATASVTPQLPHTSVTKRVVGSDVSYVGSPQNFEIVVTSDGQSPAYKVDVTDVLPKSWSLDADSAQVKVGSAPAQPLPPSTDDAGDPQTVSWNDLASKGLAAGEKIVITYTATPQTGALTDAGAGSSKAHTNTVTINAEDQTGATASGKGSYVAGPATAKARIHSADLAVTKTAVGTPVAGEAFSWKIAVKNNGGDPAVGAVVKDTVPDGVTDFSLSGTGWSCSSSATVWTCTATASIASGASAADLTATGTIDSDIAPGTDLVNTAKVSGRTYDPQPDNDSDTETVGVTARADLKIVKNLTGIITAGQDATWTLDVSNAGPSTSRGPITVKDTLPTGTTYVSAKGDGWDCSHAAGVVTCTRSADLPAVGQTAAGQITVVAAVAASRTDKVVNTATVSGKTPQPSTPQAENNDTDDATGTPTRTADLSLQKSLKGTGKAVAGSPATYVLGVTNAGPSTATGVTVTDELPDYLTFVSGGGDGWTCAAVGQVVTCDLDGSVDVGDGKTKSVEITVDVASGHTGEIVNAAKAVATEDPTGSTDTDLNTPDLVSDLAVVKTHTGDATAGESITYGVKVTNEGPSDTAGPIVVKDTVPTGMTYKSTSGAGWSCEEKAGTVTCTHEDGLVDGASRSLQLTFDVKADAGPATVVNNVAVSGPNADPEPDNDTDADDTTIVDRANVKVAKSAAVSTVHAGDKVTWTIDVSNEGPSDADSIAVSDLLPSGVTVESISGDGWDCKIEPLTCTRGVLAPGDAPSITVVTTVGSGVAADTKLTNTASVVTSTPGDDEDDNEDDAAVTTTTSADLELVKSHTGTPVAGTSATFDLAVRNLGPSDAKGPVTIADHLPAGMTYLSSNDAWVCLAGPVSPGGQDVVCTLEPSGSLVAGEKAPTLSMLVDVAADQSGRTLVNSAEVESGTTDPVPGNDSDDDTVTPADKVDLSITKTHAGPVEVGKDLSFEVEVTNDGPSEARDVEVTDALPKGLTFVSAEGTDWTCAAGACTLDAPLAPGATAPPLTIVATVTPSAYPGVTNVASVTTSSDDVDPKNDSASDEVVVPAKVDLAVTKKLEGSLRVGERGSYSLTVRNDGPTADPGVVTVTDRLPAGLTYVSATAAGWACGVADQVVTCTRDGSFAVDATETIALTVDVGAAAYPTVANTASVASTSVDTDPDDNTSSVSAPVAGSAVLTIKKSLKSDRDGRALWSIVVTNTGPTETVAPVVVTDALPKGLAFKGATGEGWTCALSGRTVTCDHAGAMAVGQRAELVVDTQITASDGSEIVNVASVVGGDESRGGKVMSNGATVTAPDVKDDDDGIGPDGLLPDTGGPAFWVLLVGLVLVLAGATMVRRPSGSHRG
ncbi:isopeptide-forming domain-containing fimbrial protein [Aeromicrobium endophyticum]|nr:isopeptide-forming domain-containing fimbrial protein [Aeromicrobium endophyticum]